MNNNLQELRRRANMLAEVLNEIKHKYNNRWYFNGVRIGRDLKSACLDFHAPVSDYDDGEYYDFPPQCLYDTVMMNAWFTNKTAQIMAKVREELEKEKVAREKMRLAQEERDRQQYLALKAKFGD